MNPKTILITGSTAGIGLAGAEILGRAGWRVLIQARSSDRGRPVLEALRARVPGGQFDLVTGDLSDLKQVVTLASQVHALTPVLDVLWNNAGVMMTQALVSADGFEYQWAVNHLAGFLLTSRLLPLVQAAPQGRILQTSSFAHHIGKVPAPGGFGLPASYNGWTTYGDTKLANILFTRELAQRLATSQVTVHAFHPGYVRTTIGSNGVPRKGNSGSWLAFVQVSVEKGAETGVFLATAPEAATVSGRYWSSKRVRRGSSKIRDDNAAALWERTEKAIEAALGA